MSIPVGVPVTFVVTNTGAADHEFFLGDEVTQAQHEDEMQDMGGMRHDTVTFPDAGSILAGCHVAGH